MAGKNKINAAKMRRSKKRSPAETAASTGSACCDLMRDFAAGHSVKDQSGRLPVWRFCPWCGSSITIKGLSGVALKQVA